MGLKRVQAITEKMIQTNYFNNNELKGAIVQGNLNVLVGDLKLKADVKNVSLEFKIQFKTLNGCKNLRLKRQQEKQQKVKS